MISAIGGTLGLFTGISVITFVEVLYWLAKFGTAMFRSLKERAKIFKEELKEEQAKRIKPQKDQNE